MVRICKGCGQEKPLSSFYKSDISRCKVCKIARQKTYASQQGEPLRERRKRYYKSNKEQFLSKLKTYRNTVPGRYLRYKERATKDKISFELTKEEFKEITSNKCNWCGQYSKGKLYCGIDRIDNNEGYHYDNCQSMCRICNRLKSNFQEDEILEHIRRIYCHLN